MTSAAAHVARVRKVFPERAEQVSLLAMRSDAFRSLCEEYGLAIEALDLLEARKLPQDAERIKEYRTLTAELQADLRRELAAAYVNDKR